MYIKEIRITGFRSYRDLTVIKDFSPRHNVVVGRNGSGKSNFFTAIQFVLSNEFSSMNQVERHTFLHEGIGNRSTVAKVEIIFDNSDKRLPSDALELSIVRQVGAKKDQYLIDGKVATRTDVVNLMESAGFSRSNPYYIVKQGKIQELATSADSSRLKLIKEVAGTRVFDEKKEESAKILTETQGKIQKSVSLLGYIQERLEKLETEKEDLKEYQEKDKMKKSIEYTIYDMEIKEATGKIEKLSSRRERINDQRSEVETELIDTKKAIQELEAEIRKLETHYKGTKEERAALLTEHGDCMVRKKQLELGIRDLKEEVERERSGRANAEESLKQLMADIADKQKRLEQLQPDFQRLVGEESRLASDIRILEQKCKETFAKQGYREQFRTKEERDRFLRKEINFLERQIGEMDDQMNEIQRSITDELKDLENLQTQFRDLNNSLHEKTAKMEELNRQETDKKTQLDSAIVAQMNVARRDKNLRERHNNLRYEVNQTEQELRRLTAKATMNGISSTNAVLKEFENEGDQEVLDGYYGCVIDLFTSPSEYNRAIEVTAESRLFYHVVETDRIALKILERINERDLQGEVNFFPLNRVAARPRRNVQDKDARPMIDFMKYDTKFEPIIFQIFANSVFVRDLAVGSRVAKEESFDCVTLEGDKVSRSGPMTGGYMDVKRSKLDMSRKLKNLQKEGQELDEAVEAITQEMTACSNVVEKLRLEINQIQQDIRILSQQHQQTLEKKRLISEQINRQSMLQEPKKTQILHLEARVRELKAHRDLITEQLNSEMQQSQISTVERAQIDQIQDEIRDKKLQLNELTKRRMTIENDIETLNNRLQSNLLRKRENLNAKVESISVGEKGNKLAAEQAEQTQINKRIMQIMERVDELDQELTDYERQRDELTVKLETSQERKKELDAQIDELAKNADVYYTKISALQAKKEETWKKMQEVQGAAFDSMSRYQSMSLKQLDKKLAEVMNDLKKYENVNKKALDQFVKASGQKDELTRRVQELQRNEESIHNLLAILDNRRYETLQLTFKQVAKNFEDVFGKLIPIGNGTLVMRSQEQSSIDTSSEQSQPARPLHVIETFVGIGIEVSFTGTGNTRDISSLSGGQKSLVALALIFAIQKCDPAPFYLFDEIDAALDQEHRRAVAEMINELSKNAQFITTTFRPELLDHAEKYYGVLFRNKVSYIDPITREQAYDFIQDDQTHS